MNIILKKPSYIYSIFSLNKNIILRNKQTKANKIKMARDKKCGPKIDSMANSLADKGFLRPTKGYIPTGNENELIDQIYEKIVQNKNSDYKLNPNEKFQILLECEKSFNHAIPNSMLYSIETVEDIKSFYKTEINKILPLDKLNKEELPKNLFILSNYHRFNPETDTKFNGISAFPGSSTIVTGLQYKKKYKGYIAPREYDDSK